MTTTLFDPLSLGPIRLPNRVVMAPLTRSRAGEGAMPTELMEAYYAQRASTGLIVSEGIVVSPQGTAYPNVPGLFSDAHIAPWRRVTEAVHARDGRIMAQLWHVGRQSHSSVQPDGGAPWAPSPVRIENFQYYRKPERLPYETPRELSREGIREVLEDFAQAARRARLAGFDGVELHGANGYLIDQFLNSGSNRRRDEYGGSVANRARFLHELLEAVDQHMPLERVGVRLSPSSTWMDAHDEDKAELHSRVITSLNRSRPAYLHLVEPAIAGSATTERSAQDVPTAQLSALFDGPVIATGGHDADSAAARLADGSADLIGFGRPLISNPDLVERLRTASPLHEPERRLFYSGGADGYLTYPSLVEEQAWEETREQIALGALDPEALRARLADRSPADLALHGELHLRTRLEALLAGPEVPAR